jgi:hypothetical protein
MSDGIDKMVENFKEQAEWLAFCNAQQKTITELSKKIKKLEDEAIHLKTLLQDNVPLLNENTNKFINSQLLLGDTEENIAKVQLQRLNEASLGRELTLEEARRVQIFSDILYKLKEKNPKDINAASRKLPTDKLLELAVNNNE